jgi:tetratricopeptide (TPR) repeat protein
MRCDLVLYFIIIVVVMATNVACPSGQGKSPDKKTGLEASRNKADETSSQQTGRVSVDELERRFNENPSSLTSASDLANEYRRQNQIEKAIGVWERIIGNITGPDREQAQINRAVLLTEVGRSEEAYNELLNLANDENGKMRSEAYFQLGNLIATGKITPAEGDKVDLAVGYFEKALDLGQTDPLLYRRLADLMYMKKNLDLAREYLAIFLVVAPNDGESWIDLGDWSKEAGDFERARVYYQRALENEDEKVIARAEKALRELPSN